MNKTLCMTCEHGLCREVDCGDPICKDKHLRHTCLLGGDYPGDTVVACNRYNKQATRITYFDPEFDDYAKYVEKG